MQGEHPRRRPALAPVVGHVAAPLGALGAALGAPSGSAAERPLGGVAQDHPASPLAHDIRILYTLNLTINYIILYIISYYTILYYIVLCYFVLYYIILYYIILCCVVLCCVVLYCIVLYCIVLYCIVLYCIVLYCIIHCVIYLVKLYPIMSCYCSISSIIVRTGGRSRSWPGEAAGLATCCQEAQDGLREEEKLRFLREVQRFKREILM